MGALLFYLAVAGFLTGGAMGVVRRSRGAEGAPGSRKGYALAVLFAVVAGLFLLVALDRMRELSS